MAGRYISLPLVGLCVLLILTGCGASSASSGTPVPTRTIELQYTLTADLPLGTSSQPCSDFLDLSQPLPAVAAFRDGEGGALCLFGFMPDEPVTVSLYPPDSNRPYTDAYTFTTNEQGAYVVLAQSGRETVLPIGEASVALEMIPTIKVRLWMPVGVELGEWRVVASGPYSGSAETTFTVAPPDHPMISTMPSTNINPLWNRGCDETRYVAGDQVHIQGSGFEPDITLPVGIYRRTQNETTRAVSFNFVTGFAVHTDEEGGFTATARIGALDEPGLYFIVGVTDTSAASFNLLEAGCYRIWGGQNEPTPTFPIPQPTP